MGKYMRKRAGRAPAAELAQAVAGFRTRSARSAASLASAAAAAAPKRPRKQAAARAEVADVGASRGDGGCAAAAEAACYLRLRSRRLFMAEARCPAALLRPVGAPPRSGGASEEPPVAAVAGTSSSCSSTASSVDVVVATAAWERSGGGAEEVREDYRGVESAASDSAGCDRERREATPSSWPPVDLRDEESGQSQQAGPTTWAAPTSVACRARTAPAAEEMEEFFAAAEKAVAERFAAKYNFDVARSLPLDAGGRFEWTTVASG